MRLCICASFDSCREVTRFRCQKRAKLRRLSTAKSTHRSRGKKADRNGPWETVAVRRRLPDERHSLTHHFSVGGQEGYVTVGLYEDGLPGEMFIRMSKEGSTVSGLMDSFATAVSLALQYGVPLQVLCDKFSHTRFEPSGWSGNPKIGYAKSLMDYLFRWLGLRFLKGEQGILFERQSSGELPHERSSIEALGQVVELGDAPTCQFCGSLMVRNGSCYRCLECGCTSGCS